MKHVGWIVITSFGPMFWPADELKQAMGYCEYGVEPVKLWAHEAELAAHEKAQEDNP